MQEHLRGAGVRFEGATCKVGPRLAFNAETQRFVDNDAANRLLTREYRAPFVVPERVGG
jgi:hypothetical protein